MAFGKIQHGNQSDLGKVTYNGFVFPPILNSSVSSQPVYDDSNRSIMYMAYSIRIEFIITLDLADTLVDPLGDAEFDEDDVYGTGGSKGSIDDMVGFLRRRLCQPGRSLVISRIGLGPDLDINNEATYSLWDVTWGPKPKMISWQPLGLNRAAKIVWECEVGLVECEDRASHWKTTRMDEISSPANSNTHLLDALPFNILQICYNQTWDIDTIGLTTKSYEAIIQTRGQIDEGDLRKVIDAADHYRIFFEPALEAGFRRTRNYRLDKAKTKLEVTITDSEIDSDYAYPPGVVDMKVDYTIGSSLLGSTPLGGTPAGFHYWEASMNGSFTLAKGYHPFWRRIYPYYIILMLIRSRFDPTQKSDEKDDQSIQDSPGEESKTKLPDFAVPLTFDMTESMFGRDFSFSFSWFLIKPPALAPAALNFGMSPIKYAEEQKKNTSSDAPSRKYWTWDEWLKSVYHGDDSSGGNWKYNTGVRIKYWVPPVYGGSPGKWKTKTIPLLSYWKGHGAPYSNRGSHGASFEGDWRQEPCMMNPSFWYSTTDKGFSQSGNTPKIGIEASVDSKFRVMSFNNKYEIIEKSGVMKHQKLTTGSRTIEQAQHGPDVGNSTSVVAPNREGNGNHTNQNLGYNPVEADFDPSSEYAGSAQVVTNAPSFLVRMYGFAIAFNQPAPVPTQTKYGDKAELIKLNNRSSQEQLQPFGNTTVWQTNWDQTYEVQGSPRDTINQNVNANPLSVPEGTGTAGSGYST